MSICWNSTVIPIKFEGVQKFRQFTVLLVIRSYLSSHSNLTTDKENNTVIILSFWTHKL